MNAHLLTEIRSKHPIVHCITNHVTSNDCANILLASGAIPVMADAPEETADITSRSNALVINLGTPRFESLSAMLAAGHEAVSLGHPVVFDPVGVGASAFRTDMAASILHDLPLTVIRGNRREIVFLNTLSENLTLTANQITNYKVNRPSAVNYRSAAAAGNKSDNIFLKDKTPAASASASGEFAGSNTSSDYNAINAEFAADALARKLECIVIMSGETDYITDGKTSRAVKNGDPILRRITGAGCMLSALVGAFLGAAAHVGTADGQPDGAANPFESLAVNSSEIPSELRLSACVAAVGAMGIAGEIAAARMTPADGNASCRNYLIDAIYRMDEETLTEKIRVE
jgi:hydroxyethylthiazole kinase